MKYKDHVYDEDLKKATIWLIDVSPVQLENLLMILKEEPDKEEKADMEEVIFS